jgi:hypothetical protein
MAVPPGNHPAAPRDSDLRRTCSLRRRVRDPRTPGFQLYSTRRTRGRVICETKRIRSHYLTLGQRKAPRTFHHPPPEGRASFSTINAATMRLCGADRPASRHPIAAGSRSHSVLPHRAYRSERRTAIFAVAAGGSSIMRASGHSLPMPLHVPRSGLTPQRRIHRAVHRPDVLCGERGDPCLEEAGLFGRSRGVLPVGEPHGNAG